MRARVVRKAWIESLGFGIVYITWGLRVIKGYQIKILR